MSGKSFWARSITAGEVEFAQQPWLDRVLIGGRDVGQMGGRANTGMRGGKLLVNSRCLVPGAHAENEACGKRHGRKRGPSLPKTESPARRFE